MPTMTAEPALSPLAATDHCDAEASQITAYVRVAKGAKFLDLCKHHFETNEIALLAAGFVVVDDQRLILSA